MPLKLVKLGLPFNAPSKFNLIKPIGGKKDASKEIIGVICALKEPIYWLKYNLCRIASSSLLTFQPSVVQGMARMDFFIFWLITYLIISTLLFLSLKILTFLSIHRFQRRKTLAKIQAQLTMGFLDTKLYLLQIVIPKMKGRRDHTSSAKKKSINRWSIISSNLLHKKQRWPLKKSPPNVILGEKPMPPQQPKKKIKFWPMKTRPDFSPNNVFLQTWLIF